MKKHLVTTLALAILILSCSVGSGAVTDITPDYYFDGVWYVGDSNGMPFEVWELGSGIVESSPGNYRLEFTMLTDLPEAGAVADDGHGDNLLTLGDLWITVGSINPFDMSPGVTRHAIALTTRAGAPNGLHGNVAQQAYPGEDWPETTKGNLYTNVGSRFSDGTYETYQQWMTANGYWYTPDDEDGDDTNNSYLAFVTGFDAEITGHSYVQWDDGTAEAYFDEDGILRNSYRITGWVDMDQIGLVPGDWDYCLFVSSECGNDGAKHVPVAEPATVGLLAAGVVAAGMRRRRR